MIIWEKPYQPYVLFNIRKSWAFLFAEVTQVLVQSLVSLKVDYCNLLQVLENNQNAAAGLVLISPTSYPTLPHCCVPSTDVPLLPASDLKPSCLPRKPK